ncbi:unnamed protein product [Colias eurytheme]|nr:unnamed protein product [Colias eurytheme]
MIVVSECSISTEVSNLFNIPGYVMYSKLRDNKRGGGILVYVRNYLKFTEKTVPSNTFENLCGTLSLGNKSTEVVAIYRPPSSNKTQFIHELRKLLSAVNKSTCKDVIVLGDINIDLKDSKNDTRDNYLDMLSEFGLMCGISNYTRIESRDNKITKSCIDHIFTRTDDTSYTAAVDTVLADHKIVIMASVYPDTLAHRYNTKPNRATRTQFDKLKNIDFECTNHMKNPDEIYNYIHTHFKNASTEHDNKKHNNCNAFPYYGWMNENLSKLCKKRDYLFHKWRADPNNHILRLQYIKVRNKTNKLLEYYRNKYYENKIKTNYGNPSKLWQIINNICGRESKSIDESILKAFEAQNISVKQIANKFSVEFYNSIKNIIPNCTERLFKESRNVPPNVCMRFQKTTHNRVSSVIKNLHNKKSPGIDGIRNVDVKYISENLTVAIVNLINISVQTGKYPDKLKVGCIRPIFKKGTHDDPVNYRPITLLSSIDKIVEKVISDQIHKFYNDNNIISTNQYGFQSGKSTNALLSDFTDTVNLNLNEKKHILVLFIDFSRAFETLDHEKLIYRLEDSGLAGTLLAWCKSYLQNRNNFVRIGSTYSDATKVDMGTAQGSVLGPLHFLAYVNKMGEAIEHSKIFQFADDTCLLVSHKNVDTAMNLLQDDFDNLCRWCHDAGLVINSKKNEINAYQISPHKRQSISRYKKSYA